LAVRGKDGPPVEATWILIICTVGLILLAAYLFYIINNLKKKQKGIYDTSREIGSLEKENISSNVKTKPSSIDTPIAPVGDVLVILHKENRKPWLKVIKDMSREGRKIIIVTKRDPSKLRISTMGTPYYIWLDRSTAHEKREGVKVINPTNLSRVLQEIDNAVDERGIVLIQDLEGLLEDNDPSRVMNFLNMLSTSCRKVPFSVIAPAPYRAIPQRTRTKLTDSFETVVI